MTDHLSNTGAIPDIDSVDNWSIIFDRPADSPYRGEDTPATSWHPGETTVGVADRCVAHPDVIRDWLYGPVPGGPVSAHGHPTAVRVARTLDMTCDNVVNVYGALKALIDAAQDAGVFGHPGMRIDIRHVVDEHMKPAGHQLTVHTRVGPTLASDLIATDQLVDWTVHGVEAGVVVLTRAADIVDRMLDAGAAHPTGVGSGVGYPRSAPVPGLGW